MAAYALIFQIGTGFLTGLTYIYIVLDKRQKKRIQRQAETSRAADSGDEAAPSQGMAGKETIAVDSEFN